MLKVTVGQISILWVPELGVLTLFGVRGAIMARPGEGEGAGGGARKWGRAGSGEGADLAGGLGRIEPAGVPPNGFHIVPAIDFSHLAVVPGKFSSCCCVKNHL